jgi:hypothetical protein
MTDFLSILINAVMGDDALLGGLLMVMGLTGLGICLWAWHLAVLGGRQLREQRVRQMREDLLTERRMRRRERGRNSWGI